MLFVAKKMSKKFVVLSFLIKFADYYDFFIVFFTFSLWPMMVKYMA